MSKYKEELVPLSEKQMPYMNTWLKIKLRSCSIFCVPIPCIYFLLGLPVGSLKKYRTLAVSEAQNIEQLTRALSGIIIIFIPNKDPKYQTIRLIADTCMAALFSVNEFWLQPNGTLAAFISDLTPPGMLTRTWPQGQGPDPQGPGQGPRLDK